MVSQAGKMNRCHSSSQNRATSCAAPTVNRKAILSTVFHATTRHHDFEQSHMPGLPCDALGKQYARSAGKESLMRAMITAMHTCESSLQGITVPATISSSDTGEFEVRHER